MGRGNYRGRGRAGGGNHHSNQQQQRNDPDGHNNKTATASPALPVPAQAATTAAAPEPGMGWTRRNRFGRGGSGAAPPVEEHQQHDDDDGPRGRGRGRGRNSYHHDDDDDKDTRRVPVIASSSQPAAQTPTPAAPTVNRGWEKLPPRTVAAEQPPQPAPQPPQPAPQIRDEPEQPQQHGRRGRGGRTLPVPAPKQVTQEAADDGHHAKGRGRGRGRHRTDVQQQQQQPDATVEVTLPRPRWGGRGAANTTAQSIEEASPQAADAQPQQHRGRGRGRGRGQAHVDPVTIAAHDPEPAVQDYGRGRGRGRRRGQGHVEAVAAPAEDPEQAVQDYGRGRGRRGRGRGQRGGYTNQAEHQAHVRTLAASLPAPAPAESPAEVQPVYQQRPNRGVNKPNLRPAGGDDAAQHDPLLDDTPSSKPHPKYSSKHDKFLAKKQRKHAKKAALKAARAAKAANATPGEPAAPHPKGYEVIDLGEIEEEEEEEEKAATSTDEDFSDTANERQKEYRPGGYHPVYVGELYGDRYRVVHKLGWGYFSTVWLVWDYKDQKYGAMKVQKSAQHYREAAYDEIKLLAQIAAGDPKGEHCCARMTDSFEHIGPHGTHVIMVFDILGENLLKLMERYEYKGIPLPIVKGIARNTLIALRYIHSLDIIHTDLKPENVMLSQPKHSISNIMKRYKPPPITEQLSLLERDRSMLTKSQRRRYDAKMRKLRAQYSEEKPGDEAAAAAPAAAEVEEGEDDEAVNDQNMTDVSAGVKAAAEAVNAVDSDTDPDWEVERFQYVSLADFGNSCWTYKQFADEVQTRQYRCPEVIIGDPYGTAIDLWSAACMFFELLTGEFLFDPKESQEYPRDEDHLALIMELLGPLPPSMACGNGKFRGNYFNSKGQLRHIRELRFWGLKDVLHKKYRFSSRKSAEIADFLLPMLVLDPSARATAEEMLEQFDSFFNVHDDDFAPACFATGESDGDDDSDLEPRAFAYGDAEPDAEEDEEDGLGRWLARHPLLHADQLAAQGLTMQDITEVLDGKTLENAEKQAAVERIIEELQNDVEDDDHDADDESDRVATDATEEEEEEEEEVVKQVP